MPISEIQHYIDFVFRQNPNENNRSDGHVFKLLNYEFIIDRLKSDPEIFQVKDWQFNDVNFYQNYMTDITKQICMKLLFNPWEFTFWLHLVNNYELDILRKRETDGLKQLKYENLLLYTGIFLKNNLYMYHQRDLQE